MTLATDMRLDAAIIAGDAAEAGETIAYTPAGGVETSLFGVVVRQPVGPDGQLRGVATQHYEVHIPRNDLATAPTAFDTLKIDTHRGDGSQVVHRVAALLPGESGFWRIRAVR